jgi:serine/threonine protein phosphatase PrpC
MCSLLKFDFQSSNVPYQLSIIPANMKQKFISDQPSDSVVDNFQLAEGDVVILATDGVWDNLFDDEIIELVRSYSGQTADVNRLEQNAQLLSEAVVTAAKEASEDPIKVSPFAFKKSIHSGKRYVGG